MKYKITIEEVTEYPEMETVYESGNGKRYNSRYNDELEGKKLDVDYFAVQHPTGRTLQRTNDVYVQEFDADRLTPIIKAVNGI